MVSPDARPDRSRWLRRAGAAAVATAVLGVGGTGLVVAVLSAQQPDSNSGTKASSDDSSFDSSSSSDSTDDQSSSGVGSTQQDSPTQGGSNGS
ncbi:hypothetical protein F1D05_28070 [Kribbella qitaiheensis]|uniref:Uncharacterized protein n=1 Tax=Kribbella qitaiheensis TaxID=1544730 RepID=A0A7G6X497_9ACTN|nr:hypothetical protein [Kribbella qitaiheensis]QNE21062.1 hypothetical protein F1D05_28070 [Kribbella qitaiheensis]